MMLFGEGAMITCSYSICSIDGELIGAAQLRFEFPMQHEDDQLGVFVCEQTS